MSSRAAASPPTAGEFAGDVERRRSAEDDSDLVTDCTVQALSPIYNASCNGNRRIRLGGAQGLAGLETLFSSLNE